MKLTYSVFASSAWKRLLLCAALLSGVAAMGCANAAEADTPQFPAPVSGIAMVLEDETRALPDSRIAWSTYWKACWQPYPGAVAYEIEVMTSEGVSPRLRRQIERCTRIEVALGNNRKEEGLLNRDTQILLSSGQLAYRIRAVLDNGRASEWTLPLMVGATGTMEGNPARTTPSQHPPSSNELGKHEIGPVQRPAPK